MTDPITDRQWGAYVAVCAERDRYREALEHIAMMADQSAVDAWAWGKKMERQRNENADTIATWRQRAEEAEEVVTGLVEDRDAYANTLKAITEVNDRYREALEHIAIPLVHDAEAQTWIARAALGLDGEG